MTTGNMKVKTFPKVMKIGNELIGLAGNLDGIIPVKEWFENGKQGEFPKVEEMYGLVVNKSGMYMFQSNGAMIPLAVPFYSIGSGSELAMGAMAAGADIKEALKIAEKYDAGTGFGMTYLELD